MPPDGEGRDDFAGPLLEGKEPPGACRRLSDVPISVQAQILKQGFQTSGLDNSCPHERMNLLPHCQEQVVPLKYDLNCAMKLST